MATFSWRRSVFFASKVSAGLSTEKRRFELEKKVGLGLVLGAKYFDL
jgi:hypothetical protein